MMSFSHRKLLFLSQIDANSNAHFLVVSNKLDCLNCSEKCPDECKTTVYDDYSLPFPPPPPPPSQKNQMPLVLILMLCVLGAAFILLSYLTILRRYRSNSSNSRRRNPAQTEGNREHFMDENRGPEVIHPIWYINTVGLEQSVIDSIAVFKYKKGEILIEGSECSVCLCEFEEDESLRLLPKCSHAFHIPCIDTWLRSHKNCPLCRAPIAHDTSTDHAVGVNTVEVVVTNSGSTEEYNPLDDDHRESNQLGGGSSIHTTDRGETISPLPNEEGKMVEMLNRAPHDSIITRNARNRVLSDLANHRVVVDEEFQPVRRSISMMDLAAASNIYAPVAAKSIHPVEEEGSSDVRDVKLKKQKSEKSAKPGEQNCLIIRRPGRSFSFGLSLQKVPNRMKRSVSSSGKLSQPRHNRSQEN